MAGGDNEQPWAAVVNLLELSFCLSPSNAIDLSGFSMIDDFFRWLVNSPWSHALNSAEWVFPAVQSLHFIGFAMSIGTIAIVDFRLLGFGKGHAGTAELAAGLAPWTLVGIAVTRFMPGADQSNATALPAFGNGLPLASNLTAPVLNFPLPAIHWINMSSAVTGTPSDHLAAALIVYLIVSGLFEVTTQVMNWSLLTRARVLS